MPAATKSSLFVESISVVLVVPMHTGTEFRFGLLIYYWLLAASLDEFGYCFLFILPSSSKTMLARKRSIFSNASFTSFEICDWVAFVFDYRRMSVRI